MSIYGINGTTTGAAARMAVSPLTPAAAAAASSTAAPSASSKSASRASATSSTPATDAPAGSSRAGATSASAVPKEVQQQEADDKPTSLRFPWLSRLSAELEAASNKRARFPTQIMGDHVDRKA